MKDTSGANYTGSTLEKFIHDRLIERGYQFIERGKFKASLYLEQPMYTRQYHIGQGIYETPLYCDFILYHPTKWKECLIIESKWQQSVGTIIYFLLLNHKPPLRRYRFSFSPLINSALKADAETTISTSQFASFLI